MPIFLVANLSWEVPSTFHEVHRIGGRATAGRDPPPQFSRQALSVCISGYEIVSSKTRPGSPLCVFATPAFLSCSRSLR